ncbi:MAG: SDR family oxidoreductase [Cyanobacteria bacterium RM1_2_2]|nr:SDR family oxidoreductase [Cyanobacteria bacterium RM1_2_2]
MSEISRRQMLTTGAIGVAGLTTAIAAQTAQANTQNPPEPQASVNPNSRFAGKVVLITGATSGIGEATARAFAAEGATVHFCGRREALGAQVAQSIRDAGGKATYQRADVRVEEDVKAFVNTCVEQYGRIDIAFNNAGIFMTPAEIQDIPLENFVDIITTNTVGVFLCMKYEIPQMRRQGGGNIVNMASVAGHVGFRTTAHYNASKHGVIGLTKAAAQENADHNIRINSISPLAVDTPMLRESFAFQGITYEQVVQGFVTKRIMTTHEMAEAAMFLASNQATSMTGMDLDVTGGQLAG